MEKRKDPFEIIKKELNIYYNHSHRSTCDSVDGAMQTKQIVYINLICLKNADILSNGRTKEKKKK